MGMGIALATGICIGKGRGIGVRTAPRDGSEPGFELGEALTEKCKLLLKVRELLLGGHGVQPALAASVSPRWTMPLHAVTLASAIFGSEFSGRNDSRMTQEKKESLKKKKVKSTARRSISNGGKKDGRSCDRLLKRRTDLTRRRSHAGYRHPSRRRFRTFERASHAVHFTSHAFHTTARV